MIDRTYANTLMNSLVLECIHNKHNLRHVPEQFHNYFNYPKNMVDHRKIKLHIEKTVETQLRLLRRIKKPEIVEVDKIDTSKRDSFINKFVKYISKIFA